MDLAETLFFKSELMKFQRRSLIKLFGLSVLSPLAASSCSLNRSKDLSVSGPQVLTTWNHGVANKIALDSMNEGMTLSDSLVKAISHVENDPKDQSVGYGGRPDEDGTVTLDACIMDENGECGSVTYIQDIKNPIEAARLVKDYSPHVILSGAGAQKFALAHGMQLTDLLSPESRMQYQEWKRKGAKYKTEANIENHDTIGMLCRNKEGNIAGGCSTSGMAFKSAGRVGDSPIIGAGLYVDNRIGASTATGLGEIVLKNLSTFLVVELMRNGKSPQDACVEAIQRIIASYKIKKDQVGLIAINKVGEIGAASILPGFFYSYTDQKEIVVNEAVSYYD